MENYENFNKIVKEFLKNNKIEHLYENFMDLLICDDRLRWFIFRDYERDCHREDVRCELTNRGIEFKDEDVEKLTELFEDNLLEDDSWHYILDETIYNYYQNKGENDNEEK